MRRDVSWSEFETIYNLVEYEPAGLCPAGFPYGGKEAAIPRFCGWPGFLLDLEDTSRFLGCWKLGMERAT